MSLPTDEKEGVSERWIRRAITVPLTFLLTLVATALCVLLPLVLVVDAVRKHARTRRWAITRMALFLVAFLWLESFGVVAATGIWLVARRDWSRFIAANARLQAVWGNALFRTAQRLYSISLLVEGEAPRIGTAPLLVLARHASTMDTVLPIVLLSYPLHWRLRFVLKRELLNDPCLDIVGQRLPNRFVRRGSGKPGEEAARVAALAEGMGERDALVIFPEGTRFSARKRQDSIARLAARGPSMALDLARELTHTLSPLRAGPLALLARGGLDLLVVAHAGLEAASSLGAIGDGALIGLTLRVRLIHIPAAEIPSDPAAQSLLLADLWRQVDRQAMGRQAMGTVLSV